MRRVTPNPRVNADSQALALRLLLRAGYAHHVGWTERPLPRDRSIEWPLWATCSNDRSWPVTAARPTGAFDPKRSMGSTSEWARLSSDSALAFRAAQVRRP